MCGECEECSEHATECKCQVSNWRYICPHCLRTFLDCVYDDDRFCYKCGQHLEVIPKQE